MEFESIEHIKEFFGIEEDDIKEITKEIKKRLTKVHNDKSNGEYKSGTQKRDHEELTDALNFIKGNNTEITITQGQWVELKSRIEELELLKNTSVPENVEKRVTELRKSVQASGVNFTKKHFSFKLTSLIIGSVLSALWFFPNMVEGNPMLNRIINQNYLVYTIVWVCAVIFISFLWVIVRRIEVKDARIRKKYVVETVQHQMFKLFLAWLRKAYYDKHDYNSDLSISTYKFNKDDLLNFILNYYPILNHRYEAHLGLELHDLYFTITKDYEREEILALSNSSAGFFRRFFGVPGEIDIELAQELTDIIMARLIERNVITKIGGNTFSDIFEYVDK